MATSQVVAALVGARKRMRRTLTVAAMAAVMIASAAAPAHASWGLTDGFGGNPASRWSPVSFNTGGGHFSNNPPFAHSGSWYGYRWVQSGGSNYSGIERNVTLPSGPAYFCNASIWLRAVQATALTHFQIRSAATGAVIKTALTSLSPSQGWQRVWIGFWDVDQRNVRVLAGVQEYSGQSGVADIRIDDLYITCDQIT
jgi:hypothetical protein